MKKEEKRLRFALFGNEFQAKKSASIQKVLSSLWERKAEIYVDRSFYDFVTQEQQLVANVTGVFDGDSFDVDYVISMGGDGTFLKAASRVGAKNVPIVGVNMGRLGFLAGVLPHEIEHAIAAIYQGDFEIEEHTVIQMETDGEPIESYPYALNDIAILKRDNASMISIRASVNGDYLVTYQADGLIVSTPTGSTAYNLSNGGPVVVPEAGILCLTPVAPHSLNIRPIAIREDSEVTLTVESRSHSFLAAIDGRSETLQEGTKVTIRKAPYSIRIVKYREQRYFSTLREKMMWGMDSRGNEGLKTED